MFGNKKRLERKLSEQGGAVAWATVISAENEWDSATNTGVSPLSTRVTEHMKVTLKVEPDGEPAFEATFHQAFAGLSPRNGCTAKVIYDPEDHSKIAIQEDQVFPPGLSREQAERASARHKQMAAAAKSGNMAEFVEEDIRARKAEAALRVQQAQAAYSGNAAQFIEEMKAKGAGDGIIVGGAPIVIGGGATKPDIADELAKLADLRDRGVLTEAEFETQKAKLLADS